jgi:hypothetical protein
MPTRLLPRCAVAALLAAPVLALAQNCAGKLPDPKAPPPANGEKFSLIASQCGVLSLPALPHRAKLLDMYDRGGSVTIRMHDDIYAVPPPPPPAAAPKEPVGRDGQRVIQLVPALTAAARENGLDPLLLHAIAHVESRHNPSAVSHAGARGVMQVMPATGRRFGVEDESALMDASTNVRASAALLRTLRERYGDDLERTLAAYNAGEGAVAKYGGVPPYPETQAYVRDVMAVYRRLSAEFSVSPDGSLRRSS